MLFEHHVADSEHQGMAGMDHLGKGCVGSVERANRFLHETDTLVTLQYRGELAAIPSGNLPVPLADECRDVGNLESTRFAGIHGPTESLERFGEERANKVGL